jgi:hypothetical protein
MPGFDGTGPAEMGPMTGRGAGYCAGYDAEDRYTPLRWRGYGPGWGMGGGWGRGRRFRSRTFGQGVPGRVRWGYGPARGVPEGWRYGPVTPSPEQETELLRREAEWLKQQLEAIDQRIQELSE